MKTMSKLFALAPSEEQAEFLNSAGKFWFEVMRDWNSEMQISYLCDGLDVNGRKLILEMAEMIKVKNK